MTANYDTPDGSSGDKDADFERSASPRGSFNTIQPEPKKSWPYSTRMTLSFALTAVMTAAVLVIVLASVWESQFIAYTRRNMQGLA